jgi:hypothetical protein
MPKAFSQFGLSVDCMRKGDQRRASTETDLPKGYTPVRDVNQALLLLAGDVAPEMLCRLRGFLRSERA